MDLNGFVGLVTGGASGLGAGTVRAIVDGGGRALIADLNAELGNALASELGNAALFVKTDVTDAGSVQAAIGSAREKLGGLHGAINCAGVGMAMRVVSKQGPHDLAVFSKVIEINLIGTFNVIRLAAAVMAENKPNAEGERGVVINTASAAAFDGQIGQAAYSASKGGIVGMTLPIARDLARSGIRVMTIAPGLFDTPLFGALPEDVKDSLAAQIPFPSRFGKPAEYASMAMEIIRNPMLNGETIRLDGAIRMAPK
jgi:NAD(P)-dependent dehydrogenase (short-subunit alcohol dehydrogenase family)